MKRLALTVFACTALAACSTPGSKPLQEPATTLPASSVGEDISTQLAAVFDGYFQEGLELSPLTGTFLGMRQYNARWVNGQTEAFRQRNHDYTTKWLQRLRAIDPQQLQGQDRISYDMFQYQLEQSLEGERFPSWMIPLNQFFSITNFVAQLGSGSSAQPFHNKEDFDNWRQRALGITESTDDMLANMRQGMAAGVVQPRVIMQKVLPQLAAHVVDQPEDSIFWWPVKALPQDFDASERAAIEADYRQLISQHLVPAYARLHDFIRDEYIPACRDSIGLTDQPGGEAWYQYRIKTQTTTDLSADEIHRFGLQEVARIRGEMGKVKARVGFEGTLAEFFTHLKSSDQFYFDSEDDLVQGYVALKDKINQALPQLFDVFPKNDYEVRAMEAFRAQSSAGADYTPGAPDGSRPGYFNVNTYNLRAQPKYGMETLSLHEASPGHHFQITIQQEIENMPMFRRVGGYTAFAEGWALYAESLGREMGLFTDPYQYFGRLSDEMLRAMRLVVDTGMHAKGWTREQAIQYMLDNSDMAESDVVAEVERYIAIPAQALSYKVGQRIITQLRQQASEQLGDGFDIREFHRLLLTGGSMPMDVLRQRVQDWIASKQDQS